MDATVWEKIVVPQELKTMIILDFSKRCSHEKLNRVFENTFFNTLETTTEWLDSDEVYVFTGDIPAMWLRDSSAQVKQYIPYAKDSLYLRRIFRGLIKRQIRYMRIDPYANAFNKEADGSGHRDEPASSPWVWERKYEIDSLCYPVDLSHRYWKATGDQTIFTEDYHRCIHEVLNLWEKEQHHAAKSDYYFRRENCPRHDTLSRHGKGAPVNETGMTWCGFRPSDDGCVFPFNIPENMFAVVALRQIEEIAQEIFLDADLIKQANTMKEQIEYGIETYGKFLHPQFGSIYAYETDGFGNHCLMDDANVPSLLSIPYFGYADSNDVVYQNTRAFVLSKCNPYYFEGSAARGIGSPHTPKGYIWPIGLMVQGLTSNDPVEIKHIMDTLLSTDASTNLMHEGFHCDHPEEYTRPWFAWANSLLGEFAEHFLLNCSEMFRSQQR